MCPCTAIASRSNAVPSRGLPPPARAQRRTHRALRRVAHRGLVGVLRDHPVPATTAGMCSWLHWRSILRPRNGEGAPSWAELRSLRRLWFPFNTRAARVDALVHAPAAFRRRGVYVAAQELGVA